MPAMQMLAAGGRGREFECTRSATRLSPTFAVISITEFENRKPNLAEGYCALGRHLGFLLGGNLTAYGCKQDRRAHPSDELNEPSDF
jgi:hypothetical protein